MFEQRPVFASLTRISDLASVPFTTKKLPREHWDCGDYVVGKVTSPNPYGARVELANGRMTEVAYGDLLVGALGVRAATLEIVGSWQGIGDDGVMQALTGAGLFGVATSVSPLIKTPIDLDYQGHVVRNDRKVTMNDFVTPCAKPDYDIPTVLIIGTSMSSGKTTVGKIIVRQLSRCGLRVAAAKLTGAGRYRDTLAMQDAGADVIHDFVDGGLPSTVCSPEQYRSALSIILQKLVDAAPEVVVAEAGASPLEPYCGDVLIEEIRDQVRFTVLCASDPYSVVGVTQGFGFDPDVVTGIATTTSSAVELVTKLSGIRAFNALDPASHGELLELLESKLSD